MPGGREISGDDVRAAARAVALDHDALAAAVGPHDAFGTYEELAAVCPPARLGLTPGAHVALFAPLFGEFE